MRLPNALFRPKKDGTRNSIQEEKLLGTSHSILQVSFCLFYTADWDEVRKAVQNVQWMGSGVLLSELQEGEVAKKQEEHFWE